MYVRLLGIILALKSISGTSGVKLVIGANVEFIVGWRENEKLTSGGSESRQLLQEFVSLINLGREVFMFFNAPLGHLSR